MFGGCGVFRDGLMFALKADGILYLKADDADVAAFHKAGCEQSIIARAIAMWPWATGAHRSQRWKIPVSWRNGPGAHMLARSVKPRERPAANLGVIRMKCVQGADPAVSPRKA